MLYFDNDPDSEGQIEINEDGMLQQYQSVDKDDLVEDKKVYDEEDHRDSDDDINSSLYS